MSIIYRKLAIVGKAPNPTSHEMYGISPHMFHFFTNPWDLKMGPTCKIWRKKYKPTGYIHWGAIPTCTGAASICDSTVMAITQRPREKKSGCFYAFRLTCITFICLHVSFMTTRIHASVLSLGFILAFLRTLLLPCLDVDISLRISNWN